MQPTNNGESAQSRTTESASIGVAGVLIEGMEAHGVYHVECVGPLEHEREAYVAVRDAIVAIELQMAAYTKPADRFLPSFRRLDEECRALQSKLNEFQLETKWVDTAVNLVTTVGKNHMLDTELAGSAYTAAWFMGLISNVSYTTGPAAGDTMASHGGWTESSNYAAATRPAPSFSAASGGSKATSSAVSFSINATDTIKGCFLNTVSTKGGTTGTLFSAGLFTGGDQPVVNGNTLNVTYTATLT